MTMIKKLKTKKIANSQSKRASEMRSDPDSTREPSEELVIVKVSCRIKGFFFPLLCNACISDQTSTQGGGWWRGVRTMLKVQMSPNRPIHPTSRTKVKLKVLVRLNGLSLMAKGANHPLKTLVLNTVRAPYMSDMFCELAKQVESIIMLQ